MIKTIKGNLLTEVKEGFIVHGCNAQGAMGAGFADQLRVRYPLAFDEYKNSQLELGSCVTVPVSETLIIVNAITQRYYKGHPKAIGQNRFVDYEAVAKCFETINKYADLPGIPNIVHFPLLGAGLAGGDWNIIQSIIDNTVTKMEKVLWVLP